MNAPLSKAEAAALMRHLGALSLEEKLEALELIEKSEEAKKRGLARSDMREKSRTPFW